MLSSVASSLPITCRWWAPSSINGLLHIALKREIPEAMKPRTIAVKNGKSEPKVIESKKAA